MKRKVRTPGMGGDEKRYIDVLREQHARAVAAGDAVRAEAARAQDRRDRALTQNSPHE